MGKLGRIFQVQKFLKKSEKKNKSNKSQGQWELFFQKEPKILSSRWSVVKKGSIFWKIKNFSNNGKDYKISISYSLIWITFFNQFYHSYIIIIK